MYNGDLQLNFLGVAAGDPCTSEEFQHIDDRLVFNLKFARDNGFIASDVYDFIEGSCVQRKGGVGHNIPNYTLPGCRAAWRVYYIATSNADGSGPSATLPHGGFIDPYSSYGPNSADFNLEMSAYLSNRAVQKALNVLGEDGEPKRWGERRLNYTRQYLACFYDTDTDPGLRPHFNSSMLPVYGRLAGKLRTIVVFNGDTDPCVQYRGTEAAVRALGLGLPTSGSWRPWFYRQRPVPLSLLDEKPPFWGPSLSRRPLPGAQLGGYVISYGSNVTFATVHGSGHMVPMFQPQAALHFFERVLRGLPLAPPLNTAALDVATDEEFFGDGYMEQWVSRAQSHEFTASEGLGRAEDEASVSNSRPIEVA